MSKPVYGWALKRRGVLTHYAEASKLAVLRHRRDGERPVRVVVLQVAEYERLTRVAGDQ